MLDVNYEIYIYVLDIEMFPSILNGFPPILNTLVAVRQASARNHRWYGSELHLSSASSKALPEKLQAFQA